MVTLTATTKLSVGKRRVSVDALVNLKKKRRVNNCCTTTLFQLSVPNG